MRYIDFADPEEVADRLWDGFGGETEIGWDIGANAGQSIHKMASMFSTVYSFEPAAECQPELNRVAGMYGNVTAYMIAVSDVDGKIQLVDIPDKIESGQLVSFEASEMEYDPYQEGSSVRTVKARTVDSLAGLIGFPDFLKIDVEGHEGKVIRGAMNTLRIYQPDLLIEIHSREIGEDIQDVLAGLNYNVEVIRHPHYTASGPGLERLWDVHYWIKAKA